MVRGGVSAKGTSILEALLGLILFSVVVPGAWAILVRSREAGIIVAQRAEGIETVRTIAWLLPTEVSGGRAGIDWWVEAGDSIGLRAFRGLALIEPEPVGVRVVRVCFRGLRSPDPQKDSVLLLLADGGWRAHALEGRTPLGSRCQGLAEGHAERWTLSPDPSGALLGRLFERGSYHVADGALRYRRGAGGRQPITPERIESGLLRGAAEGTGRFAWEITLRGPVGVPESPRGFGGLVWRGGAW